MKHPSNETVIRFLALYKNGDASTLTHLILGHGYMERGGHTHDELAVMYGITKVGSTLYAGYFTVNDGFVSVFKGGSQTLGIANDLRRNADIEMCIESSQLSDILTTLFPHITRNLIPHVMLAHQ